MTAARRQKMRRYRLIAAYVCGAATYWSLVLSLGPRLNILSDERELLFLSARAHPCRPCPETKQKPPRDYEYRLGDAVLSHARSQHGVSLFNESIGAAYVKRVATGELGTNCSGCSGCGEERQAACDRAKARILSGVCQRKCVPSASSSSDDPPTVVVHLRLGDALSGTTAAERSYHPPPPSEVARAAVRSSAGGGGNGKRVVFMYAMQSMQEPGSRTYALQEAETEQYLQSLAALMKEANPQGDVTIEEGFTWRDADRHFCQMVNAKAFLQGMGGFSKWAAQVRAVRGMDTRTELLLL